MLKTSLHSTVVQSNTLAVQVLQLMSRLHPKASEQLNSLSLLTLWKMGVMSRKGGLLLQS